jgi:hypothetical protein
MQPPTAAVVVVVGAKHQSTYVVSSDHFVRTTTGLELMTDRWLVADPSTSSPPRPPSRDRETGTHPTHPVLRLLSGSPACSLPRPRHNSHGPRPSLFFPLLFRLPPLLRLEAYSFRLPLSSPRLFCFVLSAAVHAYGSSRGHLKTQSCSDLRFPPILWSVLACSSLHPLWTFFFFFCCLCLASSRDRPH